MNSNRTAIIALAATACSFAQAQWYPITQLVGTVSVSSIPNAQLFDIISINGTPTIMGTNGTATAYSGGVGAYHITGTDFSQRNYIKGLAAQGLTSATSYGQNHAISWDGTKIATMAMTQMLDGSMRPGVARYDVATDTISPFGSLGYYVSFAPITASTTYCISGDGSTVGGQAYWRAANVGTTSTASNVMPIVSTQAGCVGLLPSTTNNGRTTCLNYDGTVAAGFGVGSSDPMIWRKVLGTWQPGVAPIATVGTETNVSLSSPTAMDGAGRYFGGNYNGGIIPDNRPAYFFDSTTGKGTLFTLPGVPIGAGQLGWLVQVVDMSSFGDIVYGFGQNNTGTPNLASRRAFVWTPTQGVQILNDFLDAQYPGVRPPVLDLTFGTAIAPDGDWVIVNTFSNAPTTTVATTAVVRLGTPLRGTGTLGDFIGSKPSKNLTFTLKDGGGITVDTMTGKLDDLGRWVWLSKIDLGASTWSLEIDGGQFLRKTIAVTQATKNALNFSLQNGDPDYSGEVDAADIDMVIAAFGSVPSDPGWNADVDVDGSDEVDAADIDIVIANFGGVDN